jgi:hypothetical protein
MERSGSDLTHLIERLEAFEEQAGVTLDALFARIANPCGGCFLNGQGQLLPGVEVNGELHPREGLSLNQKMKVFADTYDSSGHLTFSRAVHFFPDVFYGYETFTILTGGGAAPAQIAKIRVYPKLW